MARNATNQPLQAARAAKQDEFYTVLADIEKELRHYRAHFRDKVVLCNCDDPRVSNFFHYFSYNFEHLGLKRLITTCYRNSERDLFSRNDAERAIWLEYEGDKNGNCVPDISEIGVKQFRGDGDFRSQECIDLLKQADIIVTNPPFSLFREHLGQLVAHDKKFLVIGTWNAISYKETFGLIRDNKVWVGINSNRNFSGFIVPEHYPMHGTEARIDESGNRIVSSNNTCWFTNMDNAKRHQELILYRTFEQSAYPQYDNYQAVEVSRVNDIPGDYAGVMGVPITFLDKYNPDQFEIMGSDYDVKTGALQLRTNATNWLNREMPLSSS